MPTITYQRIFCKTCKDFELHDYIIPKVDEFKIEPSILEDPTKGILTCNECDTPYTDITISEIREMNEEGLLLQRKRWKEKKRSDFSKLLNFGMLGFPSILADLYTEKEVGENVKIIESDAGLEAIEEAERIEYRRVKQEQAEDIEKHKHLGRNDQCLCGSEKKFKQCCLKRINSY